MCASGRERTAAARVQPSRMCVLLQAAFGIVPKDYMSSCYAILYQVW